MAEAVTLSPEGVDLAQLRTQDTHADLVALAEITTPLPDVVIAPYEGAEVLNRAMTRGFSIGQDSEQVGTFNLVQGKGEKAWINNIRIPERQEQRLGVATYVALAGLTRAVKRDLISDPGGLSDDSLRVWQSLEAKGIALKVPDEQDQHGNPRFKISGKS